MKYYNEYIIEYRGGIERVAAHTEQDAIKTLYDYLQRENAFQHVETAEQLFPIKSIKVA